MTGNEKAVTGFSNDGKGITYFGTSGNQAKSAFVTFNGNTYYFDARGHMVTNGEYSPNGKDVYRFLPNGIMLSNAFYVDANGNTYLYNSKGQMYKGGYTKFDVTETDKDGNESKVVNSVTSLMKVSWLKVLLLSMVPHNTLVKMVSKLKIS